MPRHIIFYDTEYTTWEGAQANNWGEPWQERELVQIAAARFDLETLEIIDTLDVLVQPVINPVLSDFFTGLTGITNDDIIGRGMSFPAGLALFNNFAKGTPIASFGADHLVMRENMALNGMAQDFTGFDIRPWFIMYGREYGINESVNSGKLASILKLEIDALQEHNALHDVRSIAAAYAYLINKGKPAPF